MVVTKKVMGTVEYNDGEFAEIQEFGVEGIETCILLDQIQVHRCDTGYNTGEFKRTFCVGTLLDISTTIEVKPTSKTASELEKLSKANDEEQRSFEESMRRSKNEASNVDGIGRRKQNE